MAKLIVEFRSRLKFIAFACGFLLATQIILITVIFLVPGLYPDTENDKSAGRIVLWTPYFEHDEDYSSIGLEDGTFDCCPHKCQFVSPRAASKDDATFELRERDALVFHIRDLTDKKQLPPPSARNPDQIWVFLLQESPHHTGLELREYAGVFNVTMTYRRDSDIFHPYAKVRRLNSTARVQAWAKATATTSAHAQEMVSRPKLAAAVVSHCNTHSNRESYISDLQDHIPVDVHGLCGPFNCKRGHINACRSLRCKMEKARVCYRQLSQSYKFYLAFENSLCADYVSEKFYYALMSDMVPVVYNGAGPMAEAGLAPPHSYVNARDFGSAAELAEHLRWLDTHHEEYLAYFEWKKNYTIDVAQRDGWCELCGMVTEEKRARGAYDDLHLWWNYVPDWWANSGSLNRRLTEGRSASTGSNDPSSPSRQRICEKRPMYVHEGWRDQKYNKLL